MTRAEHLQWAKDRAIAILNNGDLDEAMTSFYSDLGKHPELQDHIVIQLGFLHQMNGLLGTPAKVREMILGTN